MRLRTLLTLSASALGLLCLATVAALILTTSRLKQGMDLLAQAGESIRLAEELEVGLLIHERDRRLLELTPTPALQQRQRATERELHALLQAMDALVGSPREQRLVEEARSQLAGYLQVAQVPLTVESELLRTRFRAVLDATEQLVDLNVQDARAARERGQRLNHMANGVGLAVALLLLAGLLAVVLAVRASVYRPLLALRQALARYRQGERGSRVPSAGPEELREIAAEFNEMADTLQQQEQARLQFVASVAHELRNPLQALQLGTQRLTRTPTLPEEEKVREVLARISTQAQRLNRMVSDLLDRARIESGNLELHPEECDAKRLAAEVVELHRPTTTKHQLELSVPPEPVLLRCDPLRLEQVLTNLVSNALKYSPEGGRVVVAVTRSPEAATLSVSDEGIGLPPEDLRRIFEPFRRSRSQRGDIPGVGLGLAVSRRIVEAHGGHIDVESEPGRGSTFRVHLPLTPPR